MLILVASAAALETSIQEQIESVTYLLEGVLYWIIGRDRLFVNYNAESGHVSRSARQDVKSLQHHFNASRTVE